MSKREEFVNKALSWEGTKEGSKGHKQIIADYNKACDKGRQADMDTKWCACFVGAVAQETDNVLKDGIGMPVDYSCGTGSHSLIEKAKKAGIWIEDDAYVPKPADAIIYDWSDSGKGDDTTGHDHTGVVVSISSTGKSFKVMEGNRKDSVSTRQVNVNAKNIRGYISPRFADEVEVSPAPAQPSEPSESPVKPSVRTMKVKTNSGLPLRMRREPNTTSERIISIPNGKTVQVSDVVEGEKIAGNTKWASCSYNGKTGYCSMAYLK